MSFSCSVLLVWGCLWKSAGSSGYGYEFQHANYKDWGDGPMADVMATLDDAIAKDSMIDADRLFLTVDRMRVI